MMRKKLEQIIENQSPSIDLTDFNTIERGLKFQLRFELGDKLENGTKERVEQATERATKLFISHIEDDSDLYIIVYDFIDEMFAKTPNHIYELLNSEFIKKEQFEENLALRYFEHEKEIDWAVGKLSIYRTKRNAIDYKTIFHGIANTEIGFTPTIHQMVYFFQPELKKWFWMYDDRGCLIFSDNVSDLKQNLEKFDNWIVEVQRQEMEKQFE